MFRVLRAGFLVLLAASFAGCGGGSSGTSGRPTGGTTVTTNGYVAIALSGGNTAGISNAWVTVDKVAFNEDQDRPWSASDSSWRVINVNPPVAFDMASDQPAFILGALTAGKSLQVGSYKQIRIFFKAFDADGTKLGGRKYFSQVLFENGQVAPIEMPNQSHGITLDGGVNIEAGKVSALTVRMQAERNIVRFNGFKVGSVPTVDAVMIRPRTETSLLVGVDRLGDVNDPWPRIADVGVAIAPSAVCGHASAPSSPCADNISVSWYSSYAGVAQSGGVYSPVNEPYLKRWGASAVSKSSGNAFMRNLSYTYLTGSDGSVIRDVGGTPLFSGPTQYDVVIQGQGMKTMVVTGMSVPWLSGELGCSRTVNYPIPYDTKQYQFIYGTIRPDLVLTASRSYALSSPMTNPSGRASVGFKLTSGLNAGKYYEAFPGNVDPFTGQFAPDSRPLVPDQTSSDLLVADFSDLSAACDQAIAEAEEAARLQVASATREEDLVPAAKREIPLRSVFSSVAPAYGSIGLGTFYTNASTQAITLNDTDFAVAPLTDATGGVSQSVDVTINGLSSVISGYGSAKRAYLVVSDVGGVVSTLDVSSCSDACTQTVSLPAGTLANGSATAVYEFAVRYWNATSEATSRSVSETNGTMKWARAASFVNLRSGAVSPNPSVTIAVP